MSDINAPVFTRELLCVFTARDISCIAGKKNIEGNIVVQRNGFVGNSIYPMDTDSRQWALA